MSDKNHLVCISFFVIILISSSFSQHQITLKPTIGGYIYNSENSLKIMENKDYVFNYGFEVSYENKDILGYDIQLDYSYIYSGFDNYLEWIRTGENGPEILDVFYSDISLTLNNLDISLKNDIDEYFSYGFGPSASIVNRSIVTEESDFVDRLASFAIGLNASIDFKYPLTEDEQYLFLCGAKCRYLFGLLYDKGLRDLSDYSQHFVTGNFTIGIGYSF